MNPIVVSKTQQVFLGKTFYLCGQYFQRGGVRLHRLVYTYNKGVIPYGGVIHHVDGNRANNSLENLQLMSLGEHSNLHHAGFKEPIPVEALIAAAEWHRSPEGRDWHKQQYENTKEKMNCVIKLNCVFCGKTVDVTKRGNNKFCSAKCCSAERRASGVDDEKRICLECGLSFTINKYKPNTFCSRNCSAAFNARKKRG